MHSVFYIYVYPIFKGFRVDKRIIVQIWSFSEESRFDDIWSIVEKLTFTKWSEIVTERLVSSVILGSA
jgi:hypothetical protein